MTQTTRPQAKEPTTAQDQTRKRSTIRKFHSSVLRWRRRASSSQQELENFLNEQDFRFAADCERMRVDRNGSMLSLLLVRLHQTRTDDVAFFARVLEGRLRITDTPGLLKDGRIAILLPDTPAEGAWKVAADISEVYPPGPERPECEVLVYPEHGKSRAADPAANRESSDDDADENSDTDHHQGEPNQEVAAAAKGSNIASGSNELFFARSHSAWKRVLDVVGGSVGLMASLPILIVAAVAVKATSRGPAFFSQQREGHGGRRFTMWKLRTMQVDAEAQKQALRKYSQQDGPAFKMKRDPRTTTVGRFLRWTSMDELPQFWNVLVGEMALVGPRPLPTEESIACDGWLRRRLQVKPGMTSTWQVSERGNVTFDEWARMDLRYAESNTMAQDLRLLFMTLPSLLLQKGMR